MYCGYKIHNVGYWNNLSLGFLLPKKNERKVAFEKDRKLAIRYSF